MVLRSVGLGRTPSVLCAPRERSVRQSRSLRELPLDGSAARAGRRLVACRSCAARVGHHGAHGLDGDRVRAVVRDRAEPLARRLDLYRAQRGRAARDVLHPAGESAGGVRAPCRRAHAALGRRGGIRAVCFRADADWSAGSQRDRHSPGGNGLDRTQQRSALDVIPAHARHDP